MSERNLDSLDAAIRAAWELIDRASAGRRFDVDGDVQIAVLIPRPRDHKDSLGGLAFLLSHLFDDAGASDAELQVFDSREGIELVTTWTVWAKRMIWLLFSLDVPPRRVEVKQAISDAIDGTREIQFGYSNCN